MTKNDKICWLELVESRERNRERHGKVYDTKARGVVGSPFINQYYSILLLGHNKNK